MSDVMTGGTPDYGKARIEELQEEVAFLEGELEEAKAELEMAMDERDDLEIEISQVRAHRVPVEVIMAKLNEYEEWRSAPTPGCPAPTVAAIQTVLWENVVRAVRGTDVR